MCFEILASATFSTILETKLRFELGRYEHASFGSNDDFFRSGRTMARLLFAGNVNYWNDVLHIWAISGPGFHQHVWPSRLELGRAGTTWPVVDSRWSQPRQRSVDPGSARIIPGRQQTRRSQTSATDNVLWSTYLLHDDRWCRRSRLLASGRTTSAYHPWQLAPVGLSDRQRYRAGCLLVLVGRHGC